MEMPKPSAEHEWLQQLIGDWTMEAEFQMAPDQPPMKNTGTEVTRSLDGMWTVGEGVGEMPDGGTATSLMSLSYDPAQQRYVGTFITSCMPYLWVYNGQLDESGKKLVLDTIGPSMKGDGTSIKYQDMIEIIDKDHRILSSQYLDDGEWKHFMTAHYRRKDS